MASNGQAWQDELQSFLPHALDCVDPKCVHPLCVNLKLTLRHAQLCQKGKQCHICQGMKSLVVTHSNSCRNYYCNVPFCFQAKVATQQQMLMDELGKTTETVDLRRGKNSQLQNKEAGENNENDSVSVSFSSVTHAQIATTISNVTATGRDECLKNMASSNQDVVSIAAANHPIVTNVPSVRKTVYDPNCTKQSAFGDSEFSESPKSVPAQKPGTRKRPGAPSKTERTKTCYQQPGTKRRLLSGQSIDKSFGPRSKAYRGSRPNLSNLQESGPVSRRASQDQVLADLPECYIDEMFSTPPSSPTFEMWFDKTIHASDCSLKTVLLETLFQLLGVVTRPKTKQQEALFVDLLERTLFEMRTEIAKQ